jgi:succinoglycan biosynthesis protein ExoU
MMTKPESGVAVLIAAFNAQETITRAIASADAQTGVAEICVINDGSTDATSAVARACDPRGKKLIVIDLDANRGPSFARNAGIDATSAPWLAVLDADDYLIEGRFEKLLAEAGGADFIADAIIRTPYPGEPGPAAPSWPAHIETPQLTLYEFVMGNMGHGGHGRDLGFVKPLMRRAFLDQHAIRYRRDLRLGEDYELYARALAMGARFRLAPAAGYVSVDRPGSISNKHGADELRALRDSDEDLERLSGLTREERSAVLRHYTHIDRRLQWVLLIEAVKARNPGAALKTFRSFDVSAHLARQLLNQAYERSVRRLSRRTSA